MTVKRCLEIILKKRTHFQALREKFRRKLNTNQQNTPFLMIKIKNIEEVSRSVNHDFGVGQLVS